MTDASCLSGRTLVHFSHNYTRVTPESPGSSAEQINVIKQLCCLETFVAFNNIDDFIQYGQITDTFSFLS